MRKGKNKILKVLSQAETILIVPDFTISVYCSSCNILLALLSLLFYSFHWHPFMQWGPKRTVDIHRKKRSEHEPEEEIIKLTTLHGNCEIWDY